jgi:hypothetical protein
VNEPLITSALFSALVLVMVGLAGVALRRTGAAGTATVLALAAVYLVVPGALAWAGVLDRYTPVPRPMLVIFPLTIATVILARSSVGGRLASTLPLRALVGFQVFRVPVELILHRLAGEGAIPYVMTYSGWNYDILTGISAGVVGILLSRGALPRAALLAWNVLGLLLLATIVTIAALSAPGPLQTFRDGPPNMLLSSFPYVWLPTVLVQLALSGHLLLFRRLRSDASS